MSSRASSQPATLALFEKRFAGDDSLLGLARLRFKQAGMGMEIHAHTQDHLRWLLGLRPTPEAPVVVHLPRDFDLLRETTRGRIVDLASHAAGDVIGCVLHDQKAMLESQLEYLAAVRQINLQLSRIHNGPVLFIEYAVGLEPPAVVEFWRSVNDLSHVAPCIDIGHVGIRAARAAYALQFPGEEICSLKTQPPELIHRIEAVQKAVAAARAVVLQFIGDIAAHSTSKPLHFHLHDGHPLSTFSPFGVADHLSFFARLPLQFEHCGARSLPPMFGPTGLIKVLKRAFEHPDPRRLSFTLEIHPLHERLALADASSLFEHWIDKTNAELMNHWLNVLIKNHDLLVSSIQRVNPSGNLPIS